MRVSIKLNPQAAAEAQRIASITERVGTTIEPMHPGVDDDDLRTYFYADVNDDRVEEVLQRLREDEEIEGAYVKPPDALP